MSNFSQEKQLWTMFYLIIVVTSFTSICQGEWFSSVGQMEDLVHDELKLLASLDKYIISERDKLSRVERLAENIRKASVHADSDVETYLGHPINQYHLVKRFTKQWLLINDLVEDDSFSTKKDFLKYFSKKRKRFPKEEDVTGSAKAIIRLQNTYRLDFRDLADGIVKGARPNQNLSVVDCFEIGRTAGLEKKDGHCISWMNEVLRRGDEQVISGLEVFDHLKRCKVEKQLMNTRVNILKTADHKDNTTKHQLNGDKKTNYSEDEKPPVFDDKAKQLFKRLCRNDYNPSHLKKMKKVQKDLKCMYWTNNNHPFLVLQPAKLEELWPSPHLVRFHDVLSDREITHIKSIAKPRLHRSQVHNVFTGVGQLANYRISKSAWMEDWEDTVVESLSERISALTGLSMATAEDLQVANYGIGGYYAPHCDFDETKDLTNMIDSDDKRIATFLVYLSDVKHGGTTVFLEPKIGVRPIKGSAVFWYNLYPSGEGDLRTVHAACPVLTGVKWIANKWIQAKDQELRRKCGKEITADNRIFEMQP